MHYSIENWTDGEVGTMHYSIENWTGGEVGTMHYSMENWTGGEVGRGDYVLLYGELDRKEVGTIICITLWRSVSDKTGGGRCRWGYETEHFLIAEAPKEYTQY